MWIGYRFKSRIIKPIRFRFLGLKTPNMKTSLLFLSFVTSIILASCVSQRSASYAYEGSPAGGVNLDQNNELFEQGVRTESNKKVIFSSSVYLTVEHPDTAILRLTNIAQKHKGYVQESGTTKCVIRIPNDSRTAAAGEIEACGKVTYKNTTGEDVTDQYADFAIRLDNAKKARMRYLELLEKAQTVAEALLVEKELERLNETIDLLEGKMNRIDHLSTYSTITIFLKEKKKPGIIGYIGIGIYHSVKWLFVRN
jgi:hypothetical protein